MLLLVESHIFWRAEVMQRCEFIMGTACLESWTDTNSTSCTMHKNVRWQHLSRISSEVCHIFDSIVVDYVSHSCGHLSPRLEDRGQTSGAGCVATTATFHDGLHEHEKRSAERHLWGWWDVPRTRVFVVVDRLLFRVACWTNGRKQRYWKTAASHFPFLWTFVMKLTPWSFNESNNLPLPFSFQAMEIMLLTLNQFEMRKKNKRRVSFNLFYAGFERRSHAFKWGHPVDTWQLERWGDWSRVTGAVIHWLTVWASSHRWWTMSAVSLIYRAAIIPPLPCCLAQQP